MSHFYSTFAPLLPNIYKWPCPLLYHTLGPHALKHTLLNPLPHSAILPLCISKIYPSHTMLLFKSCNFALPVPTLFNSLSSILYHTTQYIPFSFLKSFPFMPCCNCDLSPVAHFTSTYCTDGKDKKDTKENTSLIVSNHSLLSLKYEWYIEIPTHYYLSVCAATWLCWFMGLVG